MIRIILVLTFLMSSRTAGAQFFTVLPEKGADTQKEERIADPMESDVSKTGGARKGKNKQTEGFFPTGRGRAVEIEIEQDIPLFVNATDSLMYGLLSDRMNVCLPLDFLCMNSGYGFRRDPFTRCERFHDGIDLQCTVSMATGTT